MSTINDYTFGSIKVNGQQFRRDLLVLPDETVVYPWWRRQGHVLELSDLDPVLSARPGILIIGTGAYGMLTMAHGLEKELGERGIRLVALPTANAVAEYNRMKTTAEKVAGGFHLTC